MKHAFHLLTHPGARRPRGLAATAVALLLFFAMGILVAFTNRSLIFEQRTSANQYRSTKAFEAADAGLEWAIAQLNDESKIDTSCLVNNAGANAFKERYLTVDTNTGALTAGTAKPICKLVAGSPSCSCPTAGSTAPASAAVVPTFKVEFETVAGQNGVVRINVFGCTSMAGVCDAGGAGTPDSTAKVTALLGVIPQLGTVPGAAITARTTVNIGNAALGVLNADVATNGITIDAGGAITAPKARLTTVPGSPPSSSMIPNDTSLASMSTDQMFQSFFGMSKAEFKAAAINTTSGTLLTDVANACATCKMFWVEGDLNLNGNNAVGTTANPVVIVVNGAMNINGTADIIGLLYAASSNWDDTGGGSAFFRGAAVSEGSFTGNGTPDFYFDPGVLRQLARTPGAFIKIPGSWKDF